MLSRGPACRPRDRLAWLWLAIGASLIPVAFVQTVCPFAVWLSPLFLMRFSRTQRLARGLLPIVLVMCIGLATSWRDDFIPLPLGIPGPLAALIRGGAIIFAAVLGSCSR